MHTSEDKEVPLRAESNKVRDQWMQKITKATLEYVTTKKKMDKEKEEQCKPQLAVASFIVSVSCSLVYIQAFHVFNITC